MADVQDRPADRYRAPALDKGLDILEAGEVEPVDGSAGERTTGRVVAQWA